MINGFSADVQNEIKSYVYRLIDPRNGNTFYVGKGKGNRVFDHMKGAVAFAESEDEASEKINTIREIRSSGLDVIHVLHRHGLDEDTAFEVEAALIDAYPGLSNEAGGRGSRERGPMNALQIQNTYEAEVVGQITEKCIIIKITRPFIDSRGSIYESTRRAWKLNIDRAKRAEYLFSVVNGVVVDVFSVLSCGKDSEFSGRVAFEGNSAPEDIKSKYAGKRIPPEYRQRGGASPCLYVNC